MLVQCVSWEKVINNKRIQEGWIYYLEGNLKGMGASCLFVLKGEPVRKKIFLVEQRAFAATQGKNRIYDLWEKGQVTQKEY